MAPVLRMLQQNMGASVRVTEEIHILAMAENVDIVLVHEPFNPEGKFEGFRSPVRVVTGADPGQVALSAIAIFNPRIKLSAVTKVCNERCVCIEISICDYGEIILVSWYFPASESIDDTLEQLQELLRFLEGKQVVICMDANAKSVWWSNSDKTDPRGEKLEDFILTNSLCIANQKDPLGMMSDKVDFTDLTLMTNNIIGQIVEWQAMDDWTSCEHRTIGIELSIPNPTNTFFPSSSSDDEKPDFKAISRILGPCDEENAEEEENVEEEEPKFTMGRSKYPWWIEELDLLRQKVCTAKKRLLREKDKGMIYKRKCQFLKNKRIYLNTVRQLKSDYYRNNPGALDLSWKVEEDENIFNFESSNSVTSYEGSTTNWSQSELDVNDKLEIHEAVQSNNSLEM